MIIFANTIYLFLLILVPVFPVLYAVSLKLRRRRIGKLGDSGLVEALMPSASRAKGWVKVSLLSLAFFFFVIGLARPQMGAKLREHEKRGAEIMIALDVSNSMLAEDYSPNRLERAKLAIGRLCDQLHDDRIGLIVFAGDAFVQLPVTTDYVSAKMFLSSISTESVPVQGTAIGSAINLAIRSFSAQSEKSRAVIIITDGENHEDDAVAAARQAAEMGIRIHTIGIGSPEGKPIPIGGGLLKDRDGKTVVTHLDEKALQDIARAGSGAYVRAGNSEFGLNEIVAGIRSLEDETFKSVVFEEYEEYYMYFFAVALALLCAIPLIGSRRSGRKMF